MFKAKRKQTGEIVQILDTYTDDLTGIIYFLVWDNDNWRWRLASNYVPPNYEIEKKG